MRYSNNYDIIIIGSGCVGLFIAYTLKKKDNKLSIAIIEKEKKIAYHTSGRNSGVLHAGIYYEPGSIKSDVCINGSKRLKSWIKERNIKINECGKLIVPQKAHLVRNIEELYNRGITNGAEISIWKDSQIREYFPHVNSECKMGIWSPKTAVTNPREILSKVAEELTEMGVEFKMNREVNLIETNYKRIKTSEGEYFNYSKLINCAGIYSLGLAQKLGIGLHYRVIPFKGLYWEIKKHANINIPCNLYPVNDIDLPFLGVHFTPSFDKSKVYIGPTATLAFGKENYNRLTNFEMLQSARNIGILAKDYLTNKNKIRSYINNQALQNLLPIFLKEAQLLIPRIKLSDIEISKKVGIRPQLYNTKSDGGLENDFICVNDCDCTHVLNSISPAYTASFALADLIIEKANLL